jgi:hypothetical protein
MERATRHTRARPSRSAPRSRRPLAASNGAQRWRDAAGRPESFVPRIGKRSYHGFLPAQIREVGERVAPRFDHILNGLEVAYAIQ